MITNLGVYLKHINAEILEQMFIFFYFTLL